MLDPALNSLSGVPNDPRVPLRRLRRAPLAEIATREGIPGAEDMTKNQILHALSMGHIALPEPLSGGGRHPSIMTQPELIRLARELGIPFDAATTLGELREAVIKKQDSIIATAAAVVDNIEALATLQETDAESQTLGAPDEAAPLDAGAIAAELERPLERTVQPVIDEGDDLAAMTGAGGRLALITLGLKEGALAQGAPVNARMKIPELRDAIREHRDAELEKATREHVPDGA
jgi:hypothetical protein